LRMDDCIPYLEFGWRGAQDGGRIVLLDLLVGCILWKMNSDVMVGIGWESPENRIFQGKRQSLPNSSPIKSCPKRDDSDLSSRTCPCLILL
jgi:hypothetical protein